MATPDAAQMSPEDQVKQFKDFLYSYNQLTEQCFGDCANDFTTRKVSEKEEACASNCLDKYLKMTQRVSMRFQEFQIQQTEATGGAKSGLLGGAR